MTCKQCLKVETNKSLGQHKKCLQCSKCFNRRLFQPSNCPVCKDLYRRACDENTFTYTAARQEFCEWIQQIIRSRSRHSSRLNEGENASDIWFDQASLENYNPFWDDSLSCLKVGIGSGRSTPVVKHSIPSAVEDFQAMTSASKQSDKAQGKLHFQITPSTSMGSTNLTEEISLFSVTDSGATVQGDPIDFFQIPTLDLEERENKLRESIFKSMDEKFALLGSTLVQKVCESLKANTPGQAVVSSILFYCTLIIQIGILLGLF